MKQKVQIWAHIPNIYDWLVALFRELFRPVAVAWQMERLLVSPVLKVNASRRLAWKALDKTTNEEDAWLQKLGITPEQPLYTCEQLPRYLLVGEVIGISQTNWQVIFPDGGRSKIIKGQFGKHPPEAKVVEMLVKAWTEQED